MSVDHRLNFEMWRSFIFWAFDNPGVRERFTNATGRAFLPAAKNHIDAVIDDVTGVQREIAREFVVWATRELRGMEHAPMRFRTAR